MGAIGVNNVWEWFHSEANCWDVFWLSIVGSRQDKDYQEGRQGHHWEVLHPSQYGFPYKQEDLWRGGYHSHEVAEEQDCWVSTVWGDRESTDRKTTDLRFGNISI